MGSASNESNISLPVLRRPAHNRRRWLTLFAVQLLIIIHIIFWLLSQKYNWFGGKTITPIEPSEAMEFSKYGIINAGAIFFLLALVSTLVFGRWFCGWGCHIVLLQDGCYWILRKIGIRPKPFRSSLLMWFPMALGLYMFIWPLFYRFAIAPFTRPELEWPGISTHLTTTEFWNTFPPPIIAIPFLLVCGFATVYVLGAKGFCTYGCPYGGFFKPLDRMSPMRVRVNENCGQCGKCTAVCTSNVRVHEEVHIHKMVIDSGCMKIMDCIDACPNEALSIGFGKTAIKSGLDNLNAKQSILTLREFSLTALFLLSFLSFRGIYASVPMLMAVGLALVTTWLLFKMHEILTKPNSNFHKKQLKFHGKITKSGQLYMAFSLVVILFVLQSFIVSGSKLRGEMAIASGNQNAAIHWLKISGPLSDGGLGLLSNPNVDIALAKLYEANNNLDESERLIRRVIARVGEDEHAYMMLGQLLQLNTNQSEIDLFYTQKLEERPEWSLVWEDYVAWLKRQNMGQKAIAASKKALSSHPQNPRLTLQYGLVCMEFGDPEISVSIFENMTKTRPNDSTGWFLLSKAYNRAGDLNASRQAFNKGTSLQQNTN